MRPTSVIHKYRAVGHADEVYIGRPSKWGNPASHLAESLATVRVATRQEAIDWFEKNCQHLRAPAKRELKGKTLVCWCRPLACHGDVLAKWADEDE